MINHKKKKKKKRKWKKTKKSNWKEKKKKKKFRKKFHQADWAVSQKSTRTPEPVVILVLDYGASKGTEASTSFLSRGHTRRLQSVVH